MGFCVGMILISSVARGGVRESLKAFVAWCRLPPDSVERENPYAPPRRVAAPPQSLGYAPIPLKKITGLKVALSGRSATAASVFGPIQVETGDKQPLIIRIQPWAGRHIFSQHLRARLEADFPNLVIDRDGVQEGLSPELGVPVPDYWVLRFESAVNETPAEYQRRGQRLIEKVLKGPSSDEWK